MFSSSLYALQEITYKTKIIEHICVACADVLTQAVKGIKFDRELVEYTPYLKRKKYTEFYN